MREKFQHRPNIVYHLSNHSHPHVVGMLAVSTIVKKYFIDKPCVHNTFLMDFGICYCNRYWIWLDSCLLVCLTVKAVSLHQLDITD